jgi:hypothetical protein
MLSSLNCQEQALQVHKRGLGDAQEITPAHGGTITLKNFLLKGMMN